MAVPERKQAGVENTPAVLPKRALQKHNNYENIDNFSATLDSASVQLSSSLSAHQYSLPDLHGDIYRTIRRYGLVLSRYSIINKQKFAKRYKFPLSVVDTACRIVANYAYQDIYGDDPSIGTTHLEPLKQALNTPEPSEKAIMAALAYVGTQEMSGLLGAVPERMFESMHYAAEDINSDLAPEVLATHSRRSRRLRQFMRYADTDDVRGKREFRQQYVSLCNVLMYPLREAQNNLRKPNNSRPTDEQPDTFVPDRCKPRVISEGGGWSMAVLAKPELSISHTGKMGRRIVAANQGKYVKYLERVVTDTNQRIFSRKTRSLGGIVVVDCSGSMSLTDEEMRAIMKSSAGCTVIAYSDHGRDNGEPNMWVVAHRGRQVRQQPEYPGGNGVDGPAIQYAVSLRTCNAPIVWITDTQVTGVSGGSNKVLRDWCLKYCDKHNIHIVPDCVSATELLSKLQRGQRVIRKSYTSIFEGELP